MKTCKIEGCESKHYSLGYCRKHYLSFKKHGDPLCMKYDLDHSSICSIEGCENKYKAKGYCKKHYQKLCKYGDPLYSKIEMHGLTKTPEYWIYAAMKQRCYDKNTKSYNRYGGRGIIVCDRWRNSFTVFLEDMGERPFKDAQIDRIDNDGNYEPGNCRWVTALENIRNASCTKLTIKEVQQIKKLKKEGRNLRTLGKIYNVSKTTICDIINQRTWREV